MGQPTSNDLAHYADITTIHGIKDLVFNKNRFMRLAWGVFLIATVGLLCWYTYNTVKYYLSGPTTMRISTVQLGTYPPIHVCPQWDLSVDPERTKAASYNFTDDEILLISNTFSPFLHDIKKFITKNDTAPFQSTMKSIKHKMKKDNWRSFEDMISILSWNVSVESQEDTATIQKRLLWADGHAYLCHSISNVSQNEDLEIKSPLSTVDYRPVGDTYIVVGEDLFGEKSRIDGWNCRAYEVEVQGIQKRILLNRPGFQCTHDYNSAQACLLDCQHKRETCSCNDTASTTSYDYIEMFWRIDIFGECDESPLSSSCSQGYDYCIAQCKPCVTWKYDFTLTKECDFNAFKNYSLPYVSLRITKAPIMEVREQAYSYTATSMLSYIGGLLGLFCGASVLSFVQVFLFWWGGQCHFGKSKVEDAVVEDTAKQDNVQSWVQQAALHIPHCKQCSTVTAKNIQYQKKEEIQTSQQETNHLASYASKTTIHGIQDFLLMKNKLLKLVWGLFLLAVAGLMCEEIYRTVMNYIVTPTARTISFVPLDTYPTIHVCSDTWYNDTQARSYGFTEEDLAFIQLAFQAPRRPEDDDIWMMMMKSIEENNTAFEEQRESVQLKMKEHNVKTVRDMLNLITWNLSIQGQDFVTSKRWRGRILDSVDSTFVCHSVSNASAEHDLSITLPEYVSADEFIVVGEDPFARRIRYFKYYVTMEMLIETHRHITIEISDITERSLLAKHGTCNKGYNSSGVCRQDCASKKDLCNCNGTIKHPSYENNEDFFLLASRHYCHDNASCNQDYDKCVEMCTPCTTWEYVVQTKQYEIDVPLNITIISRMKVSQEYCTFPVRSLLSNIGGLLGMFCGGSVLSLVQLLLFWWDDGSLFSKTKRTKINNTKVHIKIWLQQAAGQIPQCKLCKKLTSTRTQNEQGGEIQTRQQSTNHIAKYAESTTIHGIKDLVFSKNKLIKIAWGLMLLVVFCLMCEEIYRTVKDYADYPTDFEESIILLDKYPPVHVCIEFSRVYSRAGLQSYGFNDVELDIIESVFNSSQVNITHDQCASIKRKMEEHNLSTVRDMINIMAKNLSIAEESMLPDDPAPQKRLRKQEDGLFYACYMFLNFTIRDGGLIITNDFFDSNMTFSVVVGEDPFGLSWETRLIDDSYCYLDVLIEDSNQLSLINKGGTCSHDYNSSGVCLQDCVSKESACNSSYPERLPSYDNNETFWLLHDPADYDNTTCKHNHEECTAKCKLIPCTTWTYQYSTVETSDLSNAGFKLNIMNPRMAISQEVYTYPASSLLANIGGLVSLFCGGSLLSIVQVILFRCGDGCCSQKGKERKEETAGIPEDDIHKWIQHAALHRV